MFCLSPLPLRSLKFWGCWDDSPSVSKWMKQKNFTDVYDTYHW